MSSTHSSTVRASAADAVVATNALGSDATGTNAIAQAHGCIRHVSLRTLETSFAPLVVPRLSAMRVIAAIGTVRASGRHYQFCMTATQPVFPCGFSQSDRLLTCGAHAASHPASFHGPQTLRRLEAVLGRRRLERLGRSSASPGAFPPRQPPRRRTTWQRHETTYQLIQRGRALAPVIKALVEWGLPLLTQPPQAAPAASADGAPNDTFDQTWAITDPTLLQDETYQWTVDGVDTELVVSGHTLLANQDRRGSRW